MKSFGKIVDLIVVLVVVAFITRLSSYLSDMFAPHFLLIDPDKVFAWSWIHHIIQFILAISVMMVYKGTAFMNWGFNLNNSKISLWIVFQFSVGWLIFYGIGAFITLKMSGNATVYSFQPTPRNVIGYSGFMFLMPGLSEETLFRGFVMVVLGQSWKGVLTVGKIALPVSGLIATVIFTFAHIGFTVVPFKIYFSTGQLIAAFGLGIFYAIVFYKTKSLLAPMLCHNISDGVGFVIVYLLGIILSK